MDRLYHIPFLDGDKIQFQTLFFGGAPSDPMDYDSLITAEICSNEDETYIIEGRKMSAWKDGLPYQIIEVCVDNLPDCWSLKITNNITGDEYCSQEFGRVKVKKETILIQSKRTSTDCFGYCYGVPDNYLGDMIVYNNSLRYCGWLKNTGFGSDIERADFSGAIKSEEITKSYQLTFNGKMPPFAANILCEQLLTGGLICIDGVDYELESYNVNNEIQTGTMYKFSIELESKCDTNANNCS